MKEVILHHSLTRDNKIVDYNAIRNYHLNRGWDDIGYHWLLERVGNKIVVYKGRDERVQGAHCYGHNKDTIGICCVGNYDIEFLPYDMFVVLLSLLRDIKDRHIGIKLSRHSDYSTKTCPGLLFPYDELLKALEKGTISLSDNLVPKEVIQSSDYYYNESVVGSTRIIETNPGNINIALKNSLCNLYGGSGTFQWAGEPVSILINDEEVINGAACHAWLGYPESVLCYYKDRTMGVERVQYAYQLSKRCIWAIGGLGLSNYNPLIEGFGVDIRKGKIIGRYSDVLRKTDHTGIGYKTIDSKYRVVYFLRPDTSLQLNYNRFRQTSENLNLINSIALDGGHIPAIRGRTIKYRVNAKQNNVVQFREVD